MAHVRSPLVVNVDLGEPFDVYVGRDRDTPWGNPFRIGPAQTRTQVIAAYRRWLLKQPELVARVKSELRGKRLGCHCKPRSCHADVLAEIANGP